MINLLREFFDFLSYHEYGWVKGDREKDDPQFFLWVPLSELVMFVRRFNLASDEEPFVNAIFVGDDAVFNLVSEGFECVEINGINIKDLIEDEFSITKSENWQFGEIPDKYLPIENKD